MRLIFMKKVFSKLLSWLLSVVMIFCCFFTTDNYYIKISIPVNAVETLIYGDYEYSINSDNTVTVVKYNGNIVELTVPSKINGKSVTGIKSFAFSRCKDLKKIIIPENIKTMDGGALAACANLETVIINAETEIINNIFGRVSEFEPKIKKIIIGEKVKGLGGYLFVYPLCHLESYEVSSNNEKYCSVDGVLFTKSMNSLLSYPLAKKDSTYVVPEGVVSFGEWCFRQYGTTDYIGNRQNVYLKKLILPNSFDIGKKNSYGDLLYWYMFEGNSSIEEVTILGTPQVLPTGLFSGCTNLVNVNLPDTIKTIEESAFSGCQSLKNVYLPNKLQTIKNNVFFNCNSIETLYFGDSLSSIYPGAFAMSKIKEYVVSDNNPYFKSIDGVIFNKEVTKLITYPNGKMDSEYHIPSGVNEILQNAINNKNIRDIYIPESVTMIYGDGKNSTSSFSGTENLTIHGYEGSFAETYANYSTSKDAGIRFVKIEVYPSRVTLNKTSTIITKGNTEILTATLTPSNTSNKTVTWTTSNSRIATVDNGKVTAVSAGTVTITAKTDNGLTATCKVTVLNPATDANLPQIVAEEVSGSVGSIIDYKISIKNNPGIVGVRFNVSYDTSVLTLQETKGGIFKDTTFGSLTSPLSVVWGDSIHDDNKTNGTVVELVFKVKDTAKSGSYPVKITYDSDDIFNSNLENVNFTVVNGSINVVDHIPGDVNGDGNVNMKDYAVLQRYLNNWNVTIVKNAADVNADGSVNMKDYALLQRYLNGWNIQLK